MKHLDAWYIELMLATCVALLVRWLTFMAPKGRGTFLINIRAITHTRTVLWYDDAPVVTSIPNLPLKIS